MPFYRVTREFLGYEEAVIEAVDEQSINKIIDEEWFDVDTQIIDSYNYTGNDDIQEL